MKIVTFNIRCSFDGDGINSFTHRAGNILLEIDRELPDVICFQEVTEDHAEFLCRHLPEYQTVYRGREKDMRDEGLAISVRRATAELYETGVEWLSKTPAVPGSRYDGQEDMPRILQTATVRLKTGEVFRVYNVHLEHIGDTVRVMQIDQVLARIKADSEAYDIPGFLLGDFNATRETDTYKHIMAAGLVDLTPGIKVTSHHYGTRPGPYQIDYILTSPKTAANPHYFKVWDFVADGIYLSDHYPIELDIEL